MHLYDSEKNIMDALWLNGSMKAGELVKIMEEQHGWNRNTTYTVIKKCVDKKFIKRLEPGYVCTPLISKKAVQQDELAELLDKFFDGSSVKLLNSLLNIKQISKFEAKAMKKAIKNKTV